MEGGSPTIRQDLSRWLSDQPAVGVVSEAFRALQACILSRFQLVELPSVQNSCRGPVGEGTQRATVVHCVGRLDVEHEAREENLYQGPKVKG